MKAATAREPHAHLYARISDPTQRKGGGLDRQTGADAASFCGRHGFALAKGILVDDGVSAFRGLHRSPKHALGRFLADVERGTIPAGDCLLIENWDRLSREDIWAAIGLVNDLRQWNIHVGRLDRGKLLRHDSDDAGDFFEAAVELLRGNSESKMKSYRNSSEWARKRERARAGAEPLTHRLPAWVEERGGKLRLVPGRAAVVRQIFALAASGHGAALIVQRLTAGGVPAFGGREPYVDEEGKRHFRAAPGGVLGAGHWNRSYVARILKDRRVLGELQPRLRDGTAGGPPIADYYPRVVSDEEFYAARAGAGGRKQGPRNTGAWTAADDEAVRSLSVNAAAKRAGRSRSAVLARRVKLGLSSPREGPRAGRTVELFTGLLRNARDGGTYYVATRTDGGRLTRVLLNTAAAEGRSPGWSFPRDTFERAVLTLLREIDPHDILNGGAPDESLALAGRLAAVEGELSEASAFMDAHGFSPTIGKRVTGLEARQRDLAGELAEARERAAHPLSEAWGEAQTLIGALEAAPDPQGARVRLRAKLRQVVDSVWLLVVPRGRSRLCAAQVWFAGGEEHRDYLILHTPPKANGRARTEGRWWARALKHAGAGPLDLRRREDAEALAGWLATADLG
jgi:DNA invertase Pin-like site-specific DNA recombinase